MRYDLSRLTADDLYLFNEGTHTGLAEKLGAHPLVVDGEPGAICAVWAPNASAVDVIGDFNHWQPGQHPLRPRGSSGIWEGWVPTLRVGDRYKYAVRSRDGAYPVDKSDPHALTAEQSPSTGSILWELDYTWGDADWMSRRRAQNAIGAPIAIYEVHLGSWMRVPEEQHRSLTYRELAPRLVDYVGRLGFTHVEFLPVMEHPFYGSWGYQTTGYFAPTSRYGTPQDFMALIDALHQAGIAVILDWVPSHFPNDAHGLASFDGTHLYEHADPRQGFHPDWLSCIFNYGRNEVRSFLLSSAHFWLDRYHIDGLRVDAVASMLYLDYSRSAGEWIPNEYGGRENLTAIHFLQQLNSSIYARFPDVQTFAEESTSWPMVSRPVHLGGLGFGLKWDLGWMHDTLSYLHHDPIHRRYHHNQLTFRLLYAFWENFVLPLSHDEVVHGKGSLLAKMPGSDWEKFANLRLLLGYLYAQAGKKLLFMGAEIGQWAEWNHDQSLEWHLLEHAPHAGVQRWVADLNRIYRQEPALHQRDVESSGFEWIDCNDSLQSTLVLMRRGDEGSAPIIVALNFTPVERRDFRIGAPVGGFWQELLNSDADIYGGGNRGNLGGVTAEASSHHGRPFSLHVNLPPLATVFLRATE